MPLYLDFFQNLFCGVPKQVESCFRGVAASRAPGEKGCPKSNVAATAAAGFACLRGGRSTKVTSDGLRAFL